MAAKKSRTARETVQLVAASGTRVTVAADDAEKWIRLGFAEVNKPKRSKKKAEKSADSSDSEK